MSISTAPGFDFGRLLGLGCMGLSFPFDCGIQIACVRSGIIRPGAGP